MILFYLIFCLGCWKKELVSSNLNLRVRLTERYFLIENVYCSSPAPRAWWQGPRQKNRFLFGFPFISNSLYFWLVVYKNIQPLLNLYLMSCLSSFFFLFLQNVIFAHECLLCFWFNHQNKPKHLIIYYK